MDAHPTNARQLSTEMARLMQLAIVCAFFGLSLIAGALLLRRVTGSITLPIGVVGLAFTCVVATVAWMARRWLIDMRHTFTPIALVVVPSVALLLLAFALSDATARLPTVCLWLVVLVEETAWWRYVHQSLAASTNTQRVGTLDAGAANDVEGTFNPAATQTIERIGVAGAETITGLYRVEFSSGEQTRDLHATFCPPLNSIPQVQAWQVEDGECRIKIVETQIYGVRAEVRRSQPVASGETIMVQLVATEELQSEQREVQHG